MIEVVPNKQNLSKLFDNLRKEDFEELKFFLKDNYKENFIKICMGAKNKWFLCDKSFNPVAIGGVEDVCGHKEKIGQVWLMCSNNVTRHKLELFKYIKNKIDEFKKRYKLLFNYIYKSNYDALKWLEGFGFKYKNTSKDYRFFYFKKEGEKFDIRYYTRK